MNLKDAMAQDLDNVFFNLIEFAETCEIAGHENVPVIVESLDLESPPSAEDGRNGLSYEGVTVYAKSRDVPENLLANRKTTFRHEEWYVLSCESDGGLKTIRLYREVS